MAVTQWQASKEEKLILAARDGKTAQLQALIEEGARVNARDPNSGETAVMKAALQGHLEALQRLMEAGADARLQLIDGTDALALAAMNGRLAIVEHLLDEVKIPWPRSQRNKALHLAAAAGHPLTATALVKAGAQLGARDAKGRRALTLAAKEGRPVTVERLLSLGARVDERDQEGRSALFWAAWRGHGSIVRMLLAAGADPRQKDSEGLAALGPEPSLASFAAALPYHPRRQEVNPGRCAVKVAEGYDDNSEGQRRVVAWSLPNRPQLKQSAWIVRRDRKPSYRALVTASESSEIWPHTWDVELEAEEEPPAFNWRRPFVTVFLPAAAEPPGKIRTKNVTPPWGVFPKSLVSAFDQNHDEEADTLILEYCCREPGQRRGCDYSCSEIWQRNADGDWVKCAASGPA